MMERRSGRRRTRGSLRKILRWVLLLVLGLYSIWAIALLYVRFLPPPGTVLALQRTIEAGWSGEWREQQRYVPLGRISPHLAHAVVAAEDTKFFVHRGVDWEGIRQAADDNWRRGRLWRGGSTITQQLVKNLFFGTRFGLVRKIFEIPLALVAEVILPKDRILELYLNVIEWGPGIFGAEVAAWYYYGIPAQRLDRDQASRLAACLPAPRERRPQEMDHYSAVIRHRMDVMGW